MRFYPLSPSVIYNTNLTRPPRRLFRFFFAYCIYSIRGLTVCSILPVGLLNADIRNLDLDSSSENYIVLPVVIFIPSYIVRCKQTPGFNKGGTVCGM